MRLPPWPGINWVFMQRISDMDIVEFAEKACGCKLLPYQQELLLRLNELRRDGKIYIVYGPKGQIHIFTDKEQKDEQTHD